MNNQILIKTTIEKSKPIKAKLQKSDPIKATISSDKGEGTTDYNRLSNHPFINDEEVIGHKSLEDYGVRTMTNLEIKEIFDRVFKGGN